MARSFRNQIVKLPNVRLPKPVKSVAPAGMGKKLGPGFKSSLLPFTPTPDKPQLNLADPQYIGAQAQGNLPFEQAYARLSGDVGALGTEYGYSTSFAPGAIDPVTGLAGDPSVQVTGFDTSNPYSRAALLQKSYDQTRAGNTTSMGARGQQFSGAYRNAQDAAHTGFNTSSEQLRGAFNEQVRQWLGGLGSARLGAGAANVTALGDLTQKGLDNPGPQSFGGVPYERDAKGNLKPLGGVGATPASVKASGTLAGYVSPKPKVISGKRQPVSGKKKKR